MPCGTLPGQPSRGYPRRVSALGKPAPPELLVPASAGRVVALAGDAGSFARAVDELRGLTSTGHTVVLVWARGEPGRALRSFKARIRLDGPAGPTHPRTLLREVRSTGGARRWWAGRGTFAGQLAAAPRVLRELREADGVILLGTDAKAVAEQLRGDGVRVVGAQERDWWTRVGQTWRTLEHQLDEGLTLDEEVGREVLDRIRLLGGPVPAEHQWLLVPLVEHLHRTASYELAAELVAYLDPGVGTAHEQAHRRGLRALVETSRAGEEAADLRPAAGAVLAAADEALAADQVDDAADLVTLALELLFHRELHADQLSSPLVEDPGAFLRDLRRSRVGTLLTGPLPSSAPETGRPTEVRAVDAAPRVVVSPGSFPQFATPVVDALRELADVDVLDLTARTELRYLGVNRLMVNKRLRAALGIPRPADLELQARLARADAVLVDWADRGALEVLLTTPSSTRLTVRVHSMDALSAWVHLLDWSRVDHLVVVSEHMRRLLDRLLGDRLAATTVHVVPNVVDTARVVVDKAEGHRRRLLMVGWGQRVKDPLWALDVLAALRARDPDWQLILLGADFLRHKAVSTDRYHEEFVERLVRDDVREAVEFVGWTEDIAPLLARAGFVLSLSRRESFGLGMMEAAASGCVPVVRDWPVFTPVGGARAVVPDDWVVETVEQAVDRIEELAEEPAWSRASAAARDAVEDSYASEDTLSTLCRVVLGDGADQVH